MIDREATELGVRGPIGAVVVGVVAEGEVGGAHGLAEEAQPDAAVAAEQAPHDLVSRRLGEAVREDGGGRLGEGRTEAVHFLVHRLLVDVDHGLASAVVQAGEEEVRTALEEALLVGGGHPYRHRLGRARRRPRLWGASRGESGQGQGEAGGDYLHSPPRPASTSA